MLQRLKDTLRPYHPRNIPHWIRTRNERLCAHTYIFSYKPAIVYLTWRGSREALHAGMRNRPLTLLYLFPHWLLPQDFAGISESVRKTLKRYPKHRVVMLCNELKDVDFFRAEGVEAIFCNHNCWVNENYFTITENAKKKYDAIYNAAMSPYKRHPLASKVESLALITYRYKNTYDKAHEDEVQKALAHATWLVDAHQDSQKATSAQVAAYCGQSRVGLCLSAAEGAMFASIEYLLCGLPIVTTRNIGGRDAFFDPDYVEWVEDDPESVRDGVKKMIARAPSPQEIRARTLEKIEAHRQCLRDYLKDSLPHFEAPWEPGTQGPLTSRDLTQLAKELARA